MNTSKVALLILDGWGISPDPKVSAIAQAKTPFFNSLWNDYTHATLNTTGLAVGLPDGQMGNSEVGHMNLGAGRVVYQELVRINESVRTGEINQIPLLIETAKRLAANPGKRLHLMGLVSDGGVHSHHHHLMALVAFFASQGVENMAIHAFTDGRDCDPRSGHGFLAEVDAHARKHNALIATITGRYYAMDRDKRWERVKLAYDALVHAKGTHTHDGLAALKAAYDAGETDEFIKPIICTNAGLPVGMIEEGDTVLCFNYRTDRGREITQVLTQQAFPDFDMSPIAGLHYITMTRYDDTYKGVQVIFEKDNLTNTLGETLAKAGKKQIRIAETEKYPHVTFFFNGGREEPFDGEERLMCPSPKVATYDLQPEMSAHDIVAAIVPKIKAGEADFVCLNFANTDMVGHTGVFAAAVAAAEAVDACLKQVVEAALAAGYVDRKSVV